MRATLPFLMLLILLAQACQTKQNQQDRAPSEVEVLTDQELMINLILTTPGLDTLEQPEGALPGYNLVQAGLFEFIEKELLRTIEELEGSGDMDAVAEVSLRLAGDYGDRMEWEKSASVANRSMIIWEEKGQESEVFHANKMFARAADQLGGLDRADAL